MCTLESWPSVLGPGSHVCMFFSINFFKCFSLKKNLNAGVLTSIDVSTTCAAMVLQEAASLKIMPSFDYTSVRPITINAETMPVFAAEVVISSICSC